MKNTFKKSILAVAAVAVFGGAAHATTLVDFYHTENQITYNNGSISGQYYNNTTGETYKFNSIEDLHANVSDSGPGVAAKIAVNQFLITAALNAQNLPAPTDQFAENIQNPIIALSNDGRIAALRTVTNTRTPNQTYSNGDRVVINHVSGVFYEGTISSFDVSKGTYTIAYVNCGQPTCGSTAGVGAGALTLVTPYTPPAVVPPIVVTPPAVVPPIVVTPPAVVPPAVVPTYTEAQRLQWRFEHGVVVVYKGIALSDPAFGQINTYTRANGEVVYVGKHNNQYAIISQEQINQIYTIIDNAIAQAEAVRKAAEKKAHDDKVANRTRDTEQAVAGAIAINILAEELINPALKEYGASVASSVGGNFENPEVRVGINVDLSKHFGEDFEGVSVNAGVSVESLEIGVGARKTWQVAEYATASVGASIGAEGVRVGPEVMFGNADFGIGVAMWGPIPVPQIKVFGYTASVVPHLALANLVVGGTTIAYKAIRSEMKAQEVAAN